MDRLPGFSAGWSSMDDQLYGGHSPPVFWSFPISFYSHCHRTWSNNLQRRNFQRFKSLNSAGMLPSGSMFDLNLPSSHLPQLTRLRDSVDVPEFQPTLGMDLPSLSTIGLKTSKGYFTGSSFNSAEWQSTGAGRRRLTHKLSDDLFKRPVSTYVWMLLLS